MLKITKTDQEKHTLCRTCWKPIKDTFHLVLFTRTIHFKCLIPNAKKLQAKVSK